MARTSITNNGVEEEPCLTDRYNLHDALMVNERATALELVDAIQERLGQLETQIFAISTGDGFTHFESFDPEYKGRYLWALERKVSEVGVLFDLFCDVSDLRSRY